MKFLAFVSLLSLSLSAFAVSKSGSVKVYDLKGSNTQVNIEITGEAAEKLFNDLGEETIEASIDANESPTGHHVIYKVGKNYTCDLEMIFNGKNKVKCLILINGKKAGNIPRASAG